MGESVVILRSEATARPDTPRQLRTSVMSPLAMVLALLAAAVMMATLGDWPPSETWRFRRLGATDPACPRCLRSDGCRSVSADTCGLCAGSCACTGAAIPRRRVPRARRYPDIPAAADRRERGQYSTQNRLGTHIRRGRPCSCNIGWYLALCAVVVSCRPHHRVCPAGDSRSVGPCLSGLALQRP